MILQQTPASCFGSNSNIVNLRDHNNNDDAKNRGSSAAYGLRNLMNYTCGLIHSARRVRLQNLHFSQMGQNGGQTVLTLHKHAQPLISRIPSQRLVLASNAVKV